jgi:hypothetical protein
MAGGVYGSRNFEQVQDHNALSNQKNFKIYIPQKTSWEYVLQVLLSKKWRFRWFLSKKVQ